ncbi:hypothetical protein PRIC1_005226 [Phytophthora ramorum]
MLAAPAAAVATAQSAAHRDLVAAHDLAALAAASAVSAATPARASGAGLDRMLHVLLRVVVDPDATVVGAVRVVERRARAQRLLRGRLVARVGVDVLGQRGRLQSGWRLLVGQRGERAHGVEARGRGLLCTRADERLQLQLRLRSRGRDEALQVLDQVVAARQHDGRGAVAAQTDGDGDGLGLRRRVVSVHHHLDWGLGLGSVNCGMTGNCGWPAGWREWCWGEATPYSTREYCRDDPPSVRREPGNDLRRGRRGEGLQLYTPLIKALHGL